MPRKGRGKPHRRRRERADSTVKMDEEYVDAMKKAEAEEKAKAESATADATSERESPEPNKIEKFEPDEGAKTFGPSNACWVVVEIAEDNQQAAVTALHFGEEVKAQLFVDFLHDQFKLVHGMKKQALKELIAKARKESVVRGSFVIAAATGATPGKEGSVKLDFQDGLDEDVKLSFAELGQALEAKDLAAALEFDFVSMMVHPGQKLASLVPPTEGKPAVDVFGNRQAEPGSEAKLSAGEDVKIEAGTCISESYGYVCWHKDELSVRSPVWVSDDWQEAHFIHFPQAVAEKVPQTDWLRELLTQKNVAAGIDEAAIARLSKETFGTTEKASLLVAKGQDPVPGKDSYVKYAFDPEKRAGRVLEDGTIDYRERNLSTGVSKDDELGTIIPAEKGTPGFNIKGEEIPAKDGEEKGFAPGPNVRLQTAGAEQKFIAEIDGAAAVKGDTLEVQPVMNISGDVSYETGNIDLPMNVEISGSVQSGFTVKAAGSILVGGTVENGASLSAGDDVVVAKGIFGEDATVFAKQNVETKFIQNSTVEALGNITVGAYIINGIVKAEGEVIVQEGGGHRAGTIVGGEVTATAGIHAKMIGSEDTDRTVAGIGPTFEQAAEMEGLEATLEECRSSIPELMKIVGLTRPDVGALKKHLAQMPPKRMDAVAEDAKQLGELLSRQRKADSELEKLEKKILDTVSKGRIVATDTVFADVQIGFGAVFSRVDADLAGAEFYLAEGTKIKWRPLQQATAST